MASWITTRVNARVKSLTKRKQRRQEWDRRWTEGRDELPWLRDEARPEVKAALEDGWIPEGASVMELGCGEGHAAAWLASNGCKVFAVDISAAVIEQARELHREANVTGELRFEVADVTARMRVEHPYDFVLDFGCFHQIPASMRRAYGRNVRQISRSGTRFLYTMTIIRGELTIDEKVDALLRTLGSGFEVVRVVPELPPEDATRWKPAAEVRIIRN